MKRIVICFIMRLPVAALLFVVWINVESFPIGESAAQWSWLVKACLLYTVCTYILLFVHCNNVFITEIFYYTSIWVLIIFGGGQAVYGFFQIYGNKTSDSSLFTLTGSFFNPGPYSGYLAMIFPICLNEWLQLKKKVNKSYIEQIAYYLSGSVILLIICILPAGMSRSAWLAAAVSGAWICGMHYSWVEKCRVAWQKSRRNVILITILMFVSLIIVGETLFLLKKDSANGRLFIWKIACQAIAKKPIMGYGVDGFAYAYGSAQEKYFEKGEYSLNEELVAGSPKYAFNDYVHAIVEWGVGFILVVLIFIGFCLWRGITCKRLSACGGIISLLVFALTSYPMQLPAFIISLCLLLAACVVVNSRIALAVFATFIGVMGAGLWKEDVSQECEEWSKVKRIYDMGEYDIASRGYQILYPTLKDRGRFLFEYGHCLYKLKKYDASIQILKEAEKYDNDPMILNIIGKNFQLQRCYKKAEEYFIRSTNRLPGRIYPCYLLTKLYSEWGRIENMLDMAEIVLKKEPKVQSAAIDEMRTEIKNLIDNRR